MPETLVDIQLAETETEMEASEFSFQLLSSSLIPEQFPSADKITFPAVEQPAVEQPAVEQPAVNSNRKTIINSGLKYYEDGLTTEWGWHPRPGKNF